MRHFIERRRRDLRLSCGLHYRDLTIFAGVKPLENRRQNENFQTCCLGFHISFCILRCFACRLRANRWIWLRLLPTKKQFTATVTDASSLASLSYWLCSNFTCDCCTTSKCLGPPLMTHRFLLFHCHSLVLTYRRCSCRRRLETKIVEFNYSPDQSLYFQSKQAKKTYFKVKFDLAKISLFWCINMGAITSYTYTV